MALSIEHQKLEHLNHILKLLVMIATRGLKQRDQIALLDAAGFSPKVIAEFLGTSSNAVRVALVGIRKAKQSRKRR